MCHAIDLFVKEDSTDGDAAFDLLVAHFTGLLFTTLGYDSIDSALQIIGHSKVSAAFKSAFLVRPALPLAKFLKADERLPATFAASLLYFFVELATAVEWLNHRDKQLVAPDILRALDRHSKIYHDALAGQFPFKYLRPAVEVILGDSQPAIMDVWDGIVVLLATQLSKLTTSKTAPSDLPEDDLTWCLYLNALCAARANSTLDGKMFPDASRKLHSALLSLPTYHDARKSDLFWQLKRNCIPLAVGLALKSTHGYAALAEWVDDLPTLVQDARTGLEVEVPNEARLGEDLHWYHLFTSDPDKHIQLYWLKRPGYLPISELVSFDEAVKRMVKTDAERTARETHRNSQGDAAEAHSNDDVEVPGREDQGDTEHTQNHIVARLGALGAWGARPFKSVRPFLARIPGLFQVGGRERPSSIALTGIDVDIERDAGTSLASDSGPSGGGPLAPEMASEGERDGSSDESFVTARADDKGQDGARARDDARAMDEEQTHVGPQMQGDEQAQANQLGRNGEQGQDDERGHDDEQEEDGEQPQNGAQAPDGAQGQETQPEDEADVQRSQRPDKVEGIGARDNAAHEGSTGPRAIPDAGPEDEQDHDDEKGRDGAQELDNAHSHVDEQDRDSERSRDDEPGQTEEVPHAETREAEKAADAPADAGHGGGAIDRGIPAAGRGDEQDNDGEHNRDDSRSQAGDVPHLQRSQTPEKVEGIGAREDAEHGGNTSVREIRDTGRRGEHDRDDAQIQAEEDSHAQRGRTPDDEEDSGASGEAGKSDGH
ncbi:hypothetical protein FB107DRAFT_252186 [Schizophyllum commune]